MAEEHQSLLDIQTELTDDTIIVRLVGEADMATSSQLRHTLLRLLDTSQRPVVIELAGLDFIDSSGIGAIIAGYKRARQLRCRYRIAAPPPQAQKVLNVTGLDQIIPIYGCVDEAVRLKPLSRRARLATHLRMFRRQQRPSRRTATQP